MPCLQVERPLTCDRVYVGVTSCATNVFEASSRNVAIPYGCRCLSDRTETITADGVLREGTEDGD